MDRGVVNDSIVYSRLRQKDSQDIGGIIGLKSQTVNMLLKNREKRHLKRLVCFQKDIFINRTFLVDFNGMLKVIT